MFYFILYDNEKLKNFKHKRKIEIVNNAVKLYRKDKPLKMFSRLLAALIWCGIPSLIVFLIFNDGLAVIGSLSLSTVILNIKLANDESSEIEPYLEKVLGQC